MKKLISTLAMSGLVMGSISTSAQAKDIEDWLRDTFSTRDYVGDWLRDVFGPVHNAGNSTPSPDTSLPSYRDAVLVMERWDRKELTRMKSTMGPMRQICSDETLLSVIVETRSQSMTQRICFKTTTIDGGRLPPVKAERVDRRVPAITKGVQRR